jgi:hypothetical protein
VVRTPPLLAPLAVSRVLLVAAALRHALYGAACATLGEFLMQSLVALRAVALADSLRSPLSLRSVVKEVERPPYPPFGRYDGFAVAGARSRRRRGRFTSQGRGSS